jgi:hypothetical protein
MHIQHDKNKCRLYKKIQLLQTKYLVNSTKDMPRYICVITCINVIIFEL